MKKTVLILMMSVGIAMSGMAGDLSITAEMTTTGPTYTMNYEMGVGVSANTEFLIRYDFDKDVFTYSYAFGDNDLTLTSSTASAQSIAFLSGGAAFIEYRIILGSDGDLAAGDLLVLDLSGMSIYEYAVTATLTDDFGEFDKAGDHDETYPPSAGPEPTPEPTPEPETPIMVPTLTEWGLLLTALIILSLGVLSIRRKTNRF